MAKIYDNYIFSFGDFLKFYQAGELKHQLYLQTDKDNGPFHAFMYTGQCVERLWNLTIPAECIYTKEEWKKTLMTKVKFGLVKETPDCGTSSVSMGIAVEYFNRHPPLSAPEAILLLNCGSGGIKFQLFDCCSDGIVKAVEEMKGSSHLPSPNAVKIGHYTPDEVRNWDSEQTNLISNFQAFVSKVGSKYHKFSIFAFVTGKVREVYEKSNDFEGKIMDYDMQSYFRNLPHVCPLYLFSFFLPQQEEARLEGIATQALYANLWKRKCLSQQVKVDQTWGIGQGSSQMGDLCLFQGGMKDVIKLALLPHEIEKQMDIAKIESLMNRWDSSEIPSVIALKSGCALLPDKYTCIRDQLFCYSKLEAYKQECSELQKAKHDLSKRLCKDKDLTSEQLLSFLLSL